MTEEPNTPEPLEDGYYWAYKLGSNGERATYTPEVCLYNSDDDDFAFCEFSGYLSRGQVEVVAPVQPYRPSTPHCVPYTYTIELLLQDKDGKPYTCSDEESRALLALHGDHWSVVTVRGDRPRCLVELATLSAELQQEAATAIDRVLAAGGGIAE